MLNIAQISLRDVLAARRRQTAVRVAACLILLPIYAPVAGWRWALPISGSYLLLQLGEFWLLTVLSSQTAPVSRWSENAVYALLALSVISFCVPAVPLAAHLGAWGVACAAYLITGAIVNAALNTIGCPPAFFASALPAFAYALALPIVCLWFNHPPSFVVTLNLVLGAVFLVFNVWQLWQNGTRGKAAEVMAMRRYIAGRDEHEARLFQLTQQDTLTGLFNRDALRTRLAGMIADGRPGTLLLIDLDGFKYVNDTLGHGAGDDVLRAAATRIKEAARQDDAAARLGGDEFALLLVGTADAAVAAAVAERLIAEIAQPVNLAGQLVNIGASIGIAMYPHHGHEAGQIFSSADLALYQAKNEGRHCARLFNTGLRDVAEGKMLRDTELRQALEDGEFEMFYQPQIRLSDGALMGAEALLRWRHPTQGVLSPASFIAALESGLLSARVGAWVIETACAQAAIWRTCFAPDFRVGVNLFGAQFRSGNLVEWVHAALTKTGLAPEALEIEITENIILRHEDDMIEPLRELRRLGVSVAFDDYGTGFASLSMLTRYPVSHLKIDRSFIRQVCENPAEAAIVRAVIGMGRALGLRVTAEGVETEEQRRWLLQEGCDEGQGYFFGKPMHAAAFCTEFGSPSCLARVNAMGGCCACKEKTRLRLSA